MNGVVLDIGGKKTAKRGLFRPPSYLSGTWYYLNIEPGAKPDLLANAENIPLPNSSVDTFIMSEVLEHLANPEQCLAEISRILKPGGHGVITIPFLYPMHADPWDFQRWTDVRIKKELESVNLDVVELQLMGGAFAVIADILHVSFSKLPAFWRRVLLLSLRCLKTVFQSQIERQDPHVTTGFGVIVRKPSVTK
jgi:SAM-dependent methyltransferase